MSKNGTCTYAVLEERVEALCSFVVINMMDLRSRDPGSTGLEIDFFPSIPDFLRI